MLRAFIRDSAIYGTSTILVRAVAILLVPIYTRFLAPADYGAIDILGVFTSFASVIVSLEIVQAMARFFPDAQGHRERETLASTTLFFALTGYSALFVAGQLGASQLAAWLLGDPQRDAVLRVALLAIWANGVFYVVQSQLRWQLMATRYATASVIYALVSMGVSVALVALARTGVAGVFAGQFVGALVGSILSIAASRGVYRATFDRRRLRSLLAFSVPLVPSSLGVYVTQYIDRITITAMLGLTQLGLFGIGYRLASMTSLLTLGVSGALTPLVYTHYRSASTPVDMARIFRYFVGIALVLALGLSVYAHELLTVLTTPPYLPGATVVPLLAPATLMAGMYVFAPGLAIEKRTGVVAVINFAGAVVNTALNVALVPVLGIVGAAAGTLTSQVLVFGVQMVLSQRAYPVPHQWPRLGLAVAGAVAAYLISTQVEMGWWPTIAVKGGLIMLAITWFVWLGLVERREIRRFTAIARDRLSIGRGAP